AEGQLLRLVAGQPVRRLGDVPVKPGTDAQAVMEDRHGHVWIGTAGGLFHYDGRRIHPVPTSDPRISSLLEDDKGHLWAGTVGGGLNGLTPRVIALETAETGLPTGIVQSLATDATGRLWATTQSGLLLRRAPGGLWQTLTSDPAWPGGRAATVAADAHGAVWIGTRDRALHRWKDGAYSSWRRVNGLASREIHGLVAARNGDVWLALSTPDVVQRLRNGKLDTFPMPEGIRVLRAIAEDTAGNIWVGSSKGMLVRIRDGVVTDETAATSGQPLSIRCLHTTPDGSLWIGYADEGIGWWKGGRFVHISPALGLPEPNVSQIVADGRGWLWFAGDHGIFKVWQADLEALALGRGESAHFIRYGPSEGLASVEANFGDSPGAARTPEGRLWIPLRTALAVVDPARAHPDLTPPAVLLKRVSVDERILAAYTSPVPVRGALDLRDATTPLRLAAGHHRVSFEFAALAFASPENVRLRHRLEGLDESWTDAGAARSATFLRLPPGRYRFHVQACNSDGVWNEAGASFAFVVAPFVWQTWWFRSAALAVLVAAIVALVRMVSLRRMQARLRLLEQQAALHKERTRIARDLHDEFGTRLTELGLLAELERTPSPELIAHIRALERDLDTLVWAINPRNDTLDHLVGFVCRVTGDFLARSSLRCRFDIPDDLPARPLSPELRHHLFLVVREALNNVVKHASATLVKLSFALEGDALRLRIENDGRGFSVAAAEAGARNGLRNMRARIEELGGRFDLASSPAAGTTLIVYVPLPPTPLPSLPAASVLPTRPQPAH
ncbi:MAG TPA: two-component regulator propeller domain-containing protein, partial [Opitutaceae bacterium]